MKTWVAEAFVGWLVFKGTVQKKNQTKRMLFQPWQSFLSRNMDKHTYPDSYGFQKANDN